MSKRNKMPVESLAYMIKCHLHATSVAQGGGNGTGGFRGVVSFIDGQGYGYGPVLSGNGGVYGTGHGGGSSLKGFMMRVVPYELLIGRIHE